MTAAAAFARRPDLSRWVGSFLAVLAVHAALAMGLWLRPTPSSEGDPADAITIELSAEPATTHAPSEHGGVQPPDAAATDAEPDGDSEPTPPAPDSSPPQFAETRPVAPPLVDLFPPVEAPRDAVVLPRSEDAKPARETENKPDPVKPDEPAKEERLTAASQAQQAAAAASGGGGRPSAAALSTWRSRIALHLTRFKRYPAAAAAARQQGTATVRFTLDGSGRVLSRTLVRGSGSAPLDHESLAMIARAQPLPAPPPGLPAPVTIDVPVRFSFR